MLQPDQLKSSEPLKWSAGTGTQVWTLFQECIEGDLQAVKQLVEQTPELVRSSCGYRSPLYFAVRENQIEVAKYLLDQGADPLGFAVNDSLLDICRDRGYESMEQLICSHLKEEQDVSPDGELVPAAIRDRDIGRVRQLLDDRPELIDMGDARSNKPIHWSAMTRQLDMIDELIARRADINAERGDYATPMQLANGDYHFRGWRDVPADWPTKPRDVIDHLRLRGAYCDICTACHIGDIQRVRELTEDDPRLANQLSKYVSYYQGGGAPIKNAAASGHIEIVKLLLELGADPNIPEEGIAPDGHALYSAVANSHYEIVKLLIEHGAKVNAEVESSADALSRAISNKDQPMIDLLCSNGAFRGVHLLAYDGDVMTAAAMFAADPKLANDTDALANAAGEGHEGFVRLMLQYQPDLPKNVEFPGWITAALTSELNELLFQTGMSPDQPDWLLIRPLHQFARTGEVQKAIQFIDKGADLHARDEDICSTPLGWAAKFGQLEMVKLLLSRGAMKVHPDDPPWARPIEWAKRRGHQEVVALLEAT